MRCRFCTRQSDDCVRCAWKTVTGRFAIAVGGLLAVWGGLVATIYWIAEALLLRAG